MSAVGSTAEVFRHEALFYRTDEEFLAGVVPFVRDGLTAGEPVLVAVPGPRLALTRAALGEAAEAVRFVDMTIAGRNPGRIIPGVLHPFLTAREGPSRAVGEPVWPGRSQVEYPPCVQHESLINLAFAGRDAAVLCPYDMVRLPAEAVADAARTHPVLVDGAQRWRSARYLPAEAAWEEFNRCPAEPAGDWRAVTFDRDGLGGLRRLVAEEGVRAGLDREQILDLQLAVNEVATNAVSHAGGAGTLRLWRDADGLVCEVTDLAGGIGRLAGRIPAGPDTDRGRGLLLVNQVCDLVHVYTDTGHNTVRLHMARRATGAA